MTRHDAPRGVLFDWEARLEDEEYRTDDEREATRELLDARREAFAEGFEDHDDGDDSWN